ncbi:MAG: FAD-linked oxidase C-terminal domain-containing protein [Haloferacaceae archaeon]
MAGTPTDSPVSEHRTDPSRERRANYDHQGGSVNRPDLVEDLRPRVDGDVRFDEFTREMFATDASMYEAMPVGVVFPKHTDDVSAVVEYCAKREVPVLPRGGGTSLAGQAVNEAVVLDFTRYMNGLVSVDPEAELATAQSGITLAQLNDPLADHGLKYAPDPAWGDKSVLGGCIGNNTTGAHSLKYGKADYYVEEAEVVLADGTVTTLGEVTLEELAEKADPEGDLEERFCAAVKGVLDDHAEEVKDRYPALKRNVSGYNFDMLVDEAEGKRSLPDDSGIDPDSEPGTVNLARLLAGSEGTLAVITEATVSLEPIPETKSVVLLTYDDVMDAMKDVAPILEHDPSAVEVMDDIMLDLARNTAEFADVVDILPEGTDSTLLVEFYADSDEEGRRKVADLLADRLPSVEPEVEPGDGAGGLTDEPTYAKEALEAHDPKTQKEFWAMRKSGLPILLSRTGDEKHLAFNEDTGVPPENLPEYVADVQEIMEENDTFASYYAHAGPGVLHIRPLINTKSLEGVETIEEIAEGITDLVVKYNGSISGEHGDGRARTQWNRKLYGDQLWQAMRDLKTAVDPDWLLNPGMVCGDVELTENLRFGPDYEFDFPFEPTLNWENDNGFQGMVELCHGCAGCRGDQEHTGGMMCPTYRAAEEEVMSTRGRANMLRNAMNGNLDDEVLFSDEFVHEVLDLCVSCKGCMNDCPSGVDMAKLKAEVEYHYKRKHGGVSFRDKLFGNAETMLKVGSAFAPLSNVAMRLPGVGKVMERTIGIAEERALPAFQRNTFTDWFSGRGGAAVPEGDAERRVLFVPDPYTNYMYVERGKAAVRVLEAAGCHVRLPEGVTDTGRPAYSKALVDVARETARENVTRLAPKISEGWDVVTVEPSASVMFQSDYPDLLSGDAVDAVSQNSYSALEYIDTFGLVENMSFRDVEESLTYHGNCLHKATKKGHHAATVMATAGYDVDYLDSTCCGMAGSFGYEAEHYSLSQSVFDILRGQIRDSDGDTVVATGASCKKQIGDGLGEKPPHPVQKVEEALS